MAKSFEIIIAVQQTQIIIIIIHRNYIISTKYVDFHYVLKSHKCKTQTGQQSRHIIITPVPAPYCV